MLGSEVGGNTLHVLSHIRLTDHSFIELIFRVSFHRERIVTSSQNGTGIIRSIFEKGSWSG
jgi:hypothetical protein